MLKSLTRYYHTLKPLRFKQVWYRLKYRLLSPAKLPKLSDAPCEVNKWSFYPQFVLKQSLWPDGRVQFLNKAGSVREPQDWNDTTHEKLWLYNLHYFDDLTAEGTEERFKEQKLFMQKWVNDNPPISGNGWEPYPLSLRLVNWVKWCQLNQDYDPQIISSIEQQADALLGQLEFHILGNHLFANAKALVFVGCFLKNRKADRYLAKGMELLAREVPEQFLADGGHFELSPMYHCILLWDLLDLYNLSLVTESLPVVEQQPVWRDVIEKALSWLEVMCHPDGDISFFNDSSLGIAPSRNQIQRYAKRLGIEIGNPNLEGINVLGHSGYSRLQAGFAVAIFDHAAIGPSYLPGHAHADNLSFEFSLGNERVFVNSGTSTYQSGELRYQQRSTSSHNTVTFDNLNSSDIWGSFRVGQRAVSKLKRSVEVQGSLLIEASHDGYSRISKGGIHKRQLKLSKDKLKISDHLQADFGSIVIAHFHLHPCIEVKSEEPQRGTLNLRLQSGAKVRFVTDGLLSVKDSFWYPEFGKAESNKKIEVAFIKKQLEVIVLWELEDSNEK